MRTKSARLYARGKLTLFGNYKLKLISKLDSLTIELTPSSEKITVTTFPAKMLLGIFPFAEGEKRSANQKMSARINFTGEDILTCVIPRNDGFKFYNEHKVG